jgi:hypothetical protein
MDSEVPPQAIAEGILSRVDARARTRSGELMMRSIKGFLAAATLLLFIAPAAWSEDLPANIVFAGARATKGPKMDGAGQRRKGGAKPKDFGEFPPKIPAKADSRLSDKEPTNAGWSGFYLGINAGAALGQSP